MAPNLRNVFIVAFLSAIVATETVASGFLIAPSSTVRQRIHHPRHSNEQPRRELDRRIQNKNAHLHSNGHQDSIAIRGGARGAKGGDDDEELKDCGGTVAGLFGNLRIPASLIAGASLGSAFALPMLDTDGASVGMAKRLYAFSMVTTLGSMLVVVILATIAMNDIAIRPTRLSKSVGDYIDENYSLEWMMVRSQFFYGAFAFLAGSAFRAWICIACPVVGRGVVGVLASLSLICMSYLLEKTHGQSGGKSLHKRIGKFWKAVGAKAKTNLLFGAGTLVWVTAVTYLIVKIPHMYFYLAKMG